MEPKIIFHIDEMNKWDLLLKNVTNLLLSYDSTFPKSKIEVLANSEAVKGFLLNNAGSYFPAMDALSQDGIQFAACNHTLQGMNISIEQIFEFVHVVPAGVRELADKQMEGYAYIKP